MIRKEILEIKKQFTMGNNSIVRVSSCHISKDGYSIHPSREFLRMTEEEACRYLDLFSRTLSGSLGKNLFNIGFPSSEKGIGKEEFALKLLDSRLKDEGILKEFYDMVSSNCHYEDDYVIILAHGCYDIPRSELENGVYDYLVCCFCPVVQSKPGLSYDRQKEALATRMKDLWLEMPRDGFLYPAFNGRRSDLHNTLYYSKKVSESQDDFLRQFVGRERPLSGAEERDWFSGALANITDGNCSFTQAREVQDLMVERMLDSMDGEVLAGKREMENLLSAAGFSDEQVEAFGNEYDAGIGRKGSVALRSLTDEKNVTVKAYGLQVKADVGTDIAAKMIDGRLCMIIPVDTGTVEVNGISCSFCIDR